MGMGKILDEYKPFFSQKNIGLILGWACFFLIQQSNPILGLNSDSMSVLALAFLMLIWWITEAVPIPVTALLPMVLLPSLQIYSMKIAASHYSNPIIFLFMGGFMLALAMEKSGLHRRIALFMVSLTGTGANGLILGFMLATSFLSMWISNTSTAVMMLPIAVSVIDLAKKSSHSEQKNFSVSILLAIAYSANIGGTATLIGTPPNIVLAGFLKENYNIEISFVGWMAFGLPFAAVMLLASFWLLTQVIFRNHLRKFDQMDDLIASERKKLGSMSRSEIITSIVFATTALAWVFRYQINYLLGLNESNSAIELSDEMIAIFATLMLFLVPVNLKKSEFVLSWEDSKNLPWGILLLFGGGLSLAAALEHTGWIKILSQSFSELSLPYLLVVLGLTASSLFLTEVMSNVALVTVFLPAVSAVAIGMGQNPLSLCISVTLASSCAFMLPMGTPPNSIVFAGGYINIKDMMKAGLWLNLFALVLIFIISRSGLLSVFQN
jgi:sodium-dependent dicarboxylate transporter 2/3/5